MTDMEIALELMTEDEKLILVRYVLEYISKRITEQEGKERPEKAPLYMEKDSPKETESRDHQ